MNIKMNFKLHKIIMSFLIATELYVYFFYKWLNWRQQAIANKLNGRKKQFYTCSANIRILYIIHFIKINRWNFRQFSQLVSLEPIAFLFENRCKHFHIRVHWSSQDKFKMLFKIYIIVFLLSMLTIICISGMTTAQCNPPYHPVNGKCLKLQWKFWKKKLFFLYNKM